MESNQKSSLEVKVQDIKIILPNKKDYKISIILSLAKKSVQFSKTFPESTLQNHLIEMDALLKIDCSDIDINKHKYSLLFVYEIGEYGRKIPIGNVPINIIQNNHKGIKQYKLAQCSDPNAILQADVQIIGLSLEQNLLLATNMKTSRVGSELSYKKANGQSNNKSRLLEFEEESKTPFFKDRTVDIIQSSRKKSQDEVREISNNKNNNMQNSSNQTEVNDHPIRKKTFQLMSPPKRTIESAVQKKQISIIPITKKIQSIQNKSNIMRINEDQDVSFLSYGVRQSLLTPPSIKYQKQTNQNIEKEIQSPVFIMNSSLKSSNKENSITKQQSYENKCDTKQNKIYEEFISTPSLFDLKVDSQKVPIFINKFVNEDKICLQNQTSILSCPPNLLQKQRQIKINKLQSTVSLNYIPKHKKNSFNISRVLSVQYSFASQQYSQSGNSFFKQNILNNQQNVMRGKDVPILTKLLTVNFVNDKYHVLKERSNYLINTLEKIRSRFSISQEELSKKTEELDNFRKENKYYADALNDQISGLKLINDENNKMITNLQGKINNLLTLNHHYVRENNVLKEKVKENAVFMHQIRKQFYNRNINGKQFSAIDMKPDKQITVKNDKKQQNSSRSHKDRPSNSKIIIQQDRKSLYSVRPSQNIKLNISSDVSLQKVKPTSCIRKNIKQNYQSGGNTPSQSSNEDNKYYSFYRNQKDKESDSLERINLNRCTNKITTVVGFVEDKQQQVQSGVLLANRGRLVDHMEGGQKVKTKESQVSENHSFDKKSSRSAKKTVFLNGKFLQGKR